MSYIVYSILLFFLENNSVLDKEIFGMQEFERQILAPFFDFICSLGILFLFYSLGKKKKKAE